MKPTPPTREEQGKIMAHAALALALMIEGDADKAASAIDDGAAVSPYALPAMLQFWCDSFIAHGMDGPTSIDLNKRTLEMKMFDLNSGDYGDSIDTDLPVDWARRMLYARAVRDRDAFAAVMQEIDGTDDENIAAHVWTVLCVCAHTMSSTPRGYVIMADDFRKAAP